MLRTSKTPVLISAIVVGVGIAIAWAFVCGIGGQLVRGLIGSERQANESLHVALDGTVFIVTTSGGNYDAKRTYRTLEGKKVELQEEESSLYFQALQNRPKEPALLSNPIEWRARIGGTTDTGNPAVYWYLIRDNSREGHAYLAGYESQSEQLIGYLDRKGFHETFPQSEDSFNLQGGLAGYSQFYYASNGYTEPPSTNPQFRYMRGSTEIVPPYWVIFLMDVDRIWRIDLRERTLSVFETTSDAISITMISEPLPLLAGDEKQNGKLEQALEESRRKTVRRLAVRHADRIEVWNPTAEAKKVFSLPERLRQADMRALSLGNGQMLIQLVHGYWERGSRLELVWLNEAGSEVRNENLELVGYVPPNPRTQAWQLAGVAPVPALWGFYEFIGRPFGFINNYQDPTYSAALKHAWRETWPACVAVLFLSAIAAWQALRWHKQHYLSGGILWAGFVFLLGVPGLVAYWLHFRGSPVAECASCGKQVPRDRDACARCAEPFPEPSLKGTEIFA
ncbi:hypothetical protein [Bythopirellula polymerisocia]|uniref:Uncharacterized protein n=1 Tax=Bythopirellula polymerisocia TaxID=2528003 RepID=A0A5C6CJD7_9BACT|nr:hypothetical protein [Bythopirellula polymerisocia]TWU23584.1 hypothetical protein Pla144_37590 [Bythopirellula polymerisocia]